MCLELVELLVATSPLELIYRKRKLIFVANPKYALSGNPFDIPSYQYPLALGSVEQEPYIIFQCRESVAQGAKSKGTVAMYLPTELKVDYNTKYEDLDMPIDQMLAGFKYLASGADMMKKMEGILRGGINGTDPITSANATAYNERAMGRLVNPHMAVLFKGVEPRIFNFTFQMLAKNAEESEQIRHIIHFFKYAMHPEVKEPGDNLSKRFFYYPENFVIGLFSPEDLYMFKISTCALESMSVDYAGSAIPSFFMENGAPVHIKLDLKFRELEILTKDRVLQGY